MAKCDILHTNLVWFHFKCSHFRCWCSRTECCLCFDWPIFYVIYFATKNWFAKHFIVLHYVGECLKILISFIFIIWDLYSILLQSTGTCLITWLVPNWSQEPVSISLYQHFSQFTMPMDLWLIEAGSVCGRKYNVHDKYNLRFTYTTNMFLTW